jgi:phosphatidylglycerophosphate synthase
MAHRSLTSGILRTVAFLFVAQAAIISACTVAYRLPAARSLLFLLAALIYHILMLAALFALRPLFVLVEGGRPLERVNASNVLSLARLSALPTIVFLVLSARHAPLLPVILPYLVLVFLTDLIDGSLARRLNQVTRIGRYLDAFSDYMVLSATLFVYLSYSLIPGWFFLLVVLRLGVVAVGNTVLYVVQRYVDPETSYLSKASIFAIMVLFAAKIFGIPYGLLFSGPSPLTLERLRDLELMVAGILIVSTFEKIGLIGQRLSAPPARNDPSATGERGSVEVGSSKGAGE